MTVRPFTASGHISLVGEKLPRISAYLPADLMLAIVDGSLDAAFDYNVAFNEGRGTAELANVEVALKSLGIARPDDNGSASVPAQDLLRLGEFVVEGGRFTWPQRAVSVKRIALTKPQVNLSRDVQQRFVWETLWKSGTTDVDRNGRLDLGTGATDGCRTGHASRHGAGNTCCRVRGTGRRNTGRCCGTTVVRRHRKSRDQ